MVARRRHPSSLADLPTELAIRIAGHIAATSVRPMEDLRSLRATCHFMRRVCSDPEVGRLISVERFYRLYCYVVPDGYLTLLPRLAQVGNLEAYFIIGMIVVLRYPLLRPLPVIDKNLERATHGRHKAAAYVAVVLLYMANGGARIDATAREYMRQAASMDDEEDSVAAPAGC